MTSASFTLERIIEKLKNDRALIVYKIRSSSAVDFRHVLETAVEEIERFIKRGKRENNYDERKMGRTVP